MEWYPWYWAKYESDTLHLTLEQDAIYRRIIDWYISHQQSIPDNDQAISTIARISREKWAEHAIIIREFFKTQGKHLHLKRADELIARQHAYSEKRSDIGRKAAETRWGKHEENQSDECIKHAPSMHHAMHGDAKPDQTINKDINTNHINHTHGRGAGEGILHPVGFEVGGKVAFLPSLETCDRLMGVAPGWDQHLLIAKYNEWHQGQERPRNPQAAFLGWAKNFTKGRRP